MEEALKSAGFSGVETVGGVIYARSNPVYPEFTATPEGQGWRLAFAWPVRATEVQMQAWTALHPESPMDIYQGETRITLLVPPATLPHWAELVQAMVTTCTGWRRITRQRDEGM